MGKKKFEEVEYDPFQEEARRSLARQVASGVLPVSNAAPRVSIGNLAVNHQPEVTSSVVPLPVQRTKQANETPTVPLTNPVKGPQKSRTFKCANATQDKELDSFLLRLEEAAGTSVPFQLIARAAIAATMRSEEQIIEQIRKRPSRRRPANVSAAEYAQFEQYWVEIVAEALRKLRPYQD